MITALSCIVAGCLAAPMASDTATFGAVPTTSTALANVRVIRAYNLRARDQQGADSGAGIGDKILVQIVGLRSLAEYVECQTSEGEEVSGCERRAVALFLDGRQVPGVTASITTSDDTGTIQFRLDRSAESNEMWSDLLGAPSVNRFFAQPTKLSVGPEGGHAVSTDVDRFRLVRMRPGKFILFGILLVVAVAVAIWKRKAVSELLRDAGKASIDVTGRARSRPLSLARCQMALWSVVVVISFVFIWLVTQNVDTITPALLALMGVGAGTGVLAVSIDATRRENRKNELAESIGSKTVLDSEIDALETARNDTSDPGLAAELSTELSKKAGLAEVVTARIADLSRAEAMQPSEGVWTDLLTDENGRFALYRVQMLVWTFVLVIIFAFHVVSRLGMPEFSATLLGLMGISNATYLGLKLNEPAP